VRWGWTIAAAAVAYHLGRTAGEQATMRALKEIPPPPDIGPGVTLTPEEVEKIVDLVPDDRGVYTAREDLP
jgi:hypothetical protein